MMFSCIFLHYIIVPFHKFGYIINSMQTYHIHINGIVQGVGFRPLIYTLAMQMQLNGYVKNGSDGLHVYFNSSE